MADDAGKTEDPTPKRLRDAQREGQFPRTQDAATWVAMASAVAVLPLSARLLQEHVRDLMALLPVVAQDPSDARVLAVVAQLPDAVLLPTLPMALAAAGGALLATFAQGVHPSSKALKPKANRLSPKQGVKRMFGVQALWEGAKALLKVCVITAAVLLVGRSLVVDLLGGGLLSLEATLHRAWDGLRSALWAAILAGLFLALADYAFQRRRVFKQLRMSMREVKDEMKQAEGDPLVKGAIRSRQMAMSRNRMLSAVAGADAVLVNPTHFAVAITYEASRGAPRVVAKGAGALALKIRERAREHRVPVIEDKPLTRALHRVCEVGEEIPAELYMAVAKILAFVMSSGRPGTRAGARTVPSPSPVPDLPSRGELRARRNKELRDVRSR